MVLNARDAEARGATIRTRTRVISAQRGDRLVCGTSRWKIVDTGARRTTTCQGAWSMPVAHGWLMSFKVC